MASRNFHKRRTKERKQRQAQEPAIDRVFGWRERAKYAPDFSTGPAMAIAAAALLITRR